MKLLLKSCFLLAGLIALVGCVRNVYIGDDENDEEKETPSSEEQRPENITLDDLKIKRLAFMPEMNPGIYGEVNFEVNASKVWTGKILHYTTDVTALKATFEVVATKVTVDGVEQTSGVSVNDFSKKKTYRLYAADNQYREFEVKLEQEQSTGIPLLALFTDGNTPIVSRKEWLPGRMVINVQQDGAKYEAYSGEMEIKGRGNNSWSLEKKPYAIKLKEKQAIMGMKKNKRWVLLANASDKTLLRNRVAFEIGRNTGLAWTSDSRFVEVMLNGKYLGNYLLCEQIRVDGNRVDIAEMVATDNEGENLTGGYLLECDRYYDEVNKFRSAYRDLPINIKEPDEDILTPNQRKYIMDYVNRVEELLYAGEVLDDSYRDYLDINSFADFWIVTELTNNHDTRLPGSCYMYKDRSGKLMAGPLWDFDLTTFVESKSFMLYDYETTDFTKTDRSLWFKRLFQDSVFKTCVKERWQSYKDKFIEIAEFIDEEAAYLEPSAEINWTVWEVNPRAGANKDLTLSWKDAVAKLRTNYLNRIQWMDGKIAAW